MKLVASWDGKMDEVGGGTLGTPFGIKLVTTFIGIFLWLLASKNSNLWLVWWYVMSVLGNIMSSIVGLPMYVLCYE